MLRLNNVTVLLLVLGLPVVAQGQTNVFIYASQRYAEQFYMMRDSGLAPVLSNLAKTLGPDFKFITRECGEVNAFYRPAEKSITLCYDYMAHVESFYQYRYLNTPKETKTLMELGVFMNTLFHELGHAAVHIRNVPVLGGEEDAVDRFATIMILEMTKNDPQRAKAMIAGNLIYKWNTRQNTAEKMLSGLVGRSVYADEHPLNEQRVFTSACIAYGSNPQLFQDLTMQFNLPRDRLARCRGEYQSAKSAVKQLFK